MKRQIHSKTSALRTLRFTLAASALVIAINLYAGEGSVVTVYTDSLSVVTTVSQANSIELRVAGPGGFRASKRSQTGSLDWYPGALVDGEYRYEIFVTTGDKPEEGAADTTGLYRENGRFKVENGAISPMEETVMPPLPNVDGQTGLESSPWYEKLADNLLDFLVPPAEAADLITNPGGVYVVDAFPNIYWDDTDAAGTEWHTWGTQHNFGIYDQENRKYVLYADVNPAFGLYDETGSFYLLNHNSADIPIFIDASSGTDVLNSNASGDIELADGAVFIDKSANFLGVGTVTPGEDIHVVSTSPAILLDAVSGGDISIQNNGGELNIYRANGSYDGYVFTIENDVGSGSYPGVGIWETEPEAPLHVSSHDGKSAELLVENTTAPSAAGDVTMFRLDNTGDKIVRFAIQAGGGTSIWTFDNEPTYNGGAGINSGRFRVAKSGTGVTEFSVDGYGNGRFYGNSYAVNHVNTSSRDSKTDFVALNEQDVLERLMRLPVSQWRYKRELQESRHIGPVAEDFQQVFGLGDGKHISTVDSEGIALAAIKAVKAEKDAEIAVLRAEKNAEIAALKSEKDAEIAALKAEKDAEVAALSDRLMALEDLLLSQQPVSAR